MLPGGMKMLPPTLSAGERQPAATLARPLSLRGEDTSTRDQSVPTLPNMRLELHAVGMMS